MRVQILKIVVIVLVCCGLGMAAAQPVEATTSSRNFANWLQSVAKKTHASDLNHKLASLKNSHVNLYQLIAEASQIVSQNNDDFNLPLDDSSASDRVHHILLVEWNQFQTGNSMTAIPPVPTVKTFVSFQSPKIYTGSFDSLIKLTNPSLYFIDGYTGDDSFFSASYFKTPMIGGVAIGAP